MPSANDNERIIALPGMNPLRRIEVMVLSLIVLMGAANLIYPFNGDQALFTIGAKCLADGGVLYRDFWDLKQPGIYWFYHLAGAIFGYSEIGIHAFELIWFVLLAILISITTRMQFRIASMSAVCGLLSVGVYFSVCGSWHLAQVEGLVWLPIFLCIWLTVPGNPARRSPKWKLFAFGLLVAVIACFKLMLIAIPILFLVISLLPKRKENPMRYCLWVCASCLTVLCGTALVVGVIVWYFASVHQLGLMYTTFFKYPPRIMVELPMNHVIVLLRSGKWFLLAAGPLLPLACIGIITSVGQRRSRFSISLVLWLGMAIVLVLIQRMWWEYHFLLVLFPLSMLAARGMEDAILWLKSRNIHATLLLITLTLAPFGLRTAYKLFNELRFHNLQQFRSHVSTEYADSALESDWLVANSKLADQIYVVGNPLIYFLSNHSQSIPINGWSPEFLLSEQWTQLTDQLRASRSKYIFIAHDVEDVVNDRGKQLNQLISQNYIAAHTDDVGTWYEMRGK